MSKQSKKARFAVRARSRRIADLIHAANKDNPDYVGCNPRAIVMDGNRIAPGAWFIYKSNTTPEEREKLLGQIEAGLEKPRK